MKFCNAEFVRKSNPTVVTHGRTLSELFDLRGEVAQVCGKVPCGSLLLSSTLNVSDRVPAALCWKTRVQTGSSGFVGALHGSRRPTLVNVTACKSEGTCICGAAYSAWGCKGAVQTLTLLERHTAQWQDSRVILKIEAGDAVLSKILPRLPGTCVWVYNGGGTTRYVNIWGC